MKFKFFLFWLFLAAFFFCNVSGFAETKEKLCGLTEVGVFIEIEKPPQELQAINKNQLQTYVETRLRQAGIKVTTPTDVGTRPELSFIYLNVTIRKLEKLYAYSTDLMCLLSYPRQNSATYSPVWIMRRSGLTAKAIEVKKKVMDLVNNFIEDYTYANPHAQMRRNTNFSWEGQR
jgi:hypothetical protein